MDMTFGKFKTLIENTLLESYTNTTRFKQSIKEFKHNVLKHKNVSKLYSLYDQLSTPQGLTESEAKEYLNEGITLIQYLIPKVKLPKSLNESKRNDYEDIDILVYTNKSDITERIESKNKIISRLMGEKNSIKESVNIPIKSMVKIANQTLSNYIDTLDESTKKSFINLISEDTEVLQTKFEQLRENTINKLNVLLENETEDETKNTLLETIKKIETDEFDQLNYVRLKNLESSL